MWRSLELNSAPADDTDLFGWVSTIARNVVRDHYHRTPHLDVETSAPHEVLDWYPDHLDTGLPAGDAPVQQLAQMGHLPPHDMTQALAAAMARLPADARRAVELRVAGGAPVKVIARDMRRANTTIYRLVEEGLAALRAELAA